MAIARIFATYSEYNTQERGKRGRCGYEQRKTKNPAQEYIREDICRQESIAVVPL